MASLSQSLICPIALEMLCAMLDAMLTRLAAAELADESIEAHALDAAPLILAHAVDALLLIPAHATEAAALMADQMEDRFVLMLLAVVVTDREVCVASVFRVFDMVLDAFPTC